MSRLPFSERRLAVQWAEQERKAIEFRSTDVGCPMVERCNALDYVRRRSSLEGVGGQLDR
jgi:hypothetical protein